jgi:hypothetical protein
MVRFLLSVLVGLVLGAGLGLYLGWVQFPVRYVDSPARDLGQQYKDDYTVMIAGGYLADRDLVGATQRLRALGIEDVANYVQGVTERYISTSKDVNDIRPLVALAEGLGRLSAMMEPYRLVTVPGQGS